MKKTLKLKPSLLVLLGIAALSASAGCGQAPGQPIVGTNSAAGTTPTNVIGPTGSTIVTTGSPTYQFHFQELGQNLATQVGGGAMSVTTDTLLQIVVTAGNGGQPVGNTGFTGAFNCEKFEIKVGSASQSVFVAVPGYSDYMFNYNNRYDPCANAPTSWGYDFSSTLGVSHSGPITIQVNSAKYDNCRTIGEPDYAGCGTSSLTSVYQSDSVDGNIQVFTD